MRQYETWEITLHGEVLPRGYADTDINAVFICDGNETRVSGFYAGNGEYKIRFLPEKPGIYTWKISGVVSGEGTDVCETADGKHHGAVKAVGTHFKYSDGTIFHPFGTTVYALASQEDSLVEETLRSLSEAPFNKIRMCVFPKDYEYNHNEPPFYAFEKDSSGNWDVSTPCLPFWERFERILDKINDMGIEIDLILFHPYDRWGFNALTQKENLLYLDYLLRRLSARPGIWWSLANEYDLTLDHKTLSDWEAIEEYVSVHDPYHHLLSNHNCMAFWDYNRPNITHVSIQTKALAEIPHWLKRYNKPVIIDECCYEGDIPQFWGSISGKEMVNRFWRAITGGGYCTHGETFLSDDEILWWSRGGKLKGESPERIRFLRNIVEEFPGPLTPVSGWLDRLEQHACGHTDDNLSDIEELFAMSIARMDPSDREIHIMSEHSWASCCGEDVFLWFNDKQCYGRQNLYLPEDKSYRIELIDVWEMTRTVICESVNGETTIKLPRKESLAVLAIKQP